MAFDIYDGYGELVITDIGWGYDIVTKTVGYSPIAMLAVIVLGVLVVAAVIGFEYILYNSSMPLVRSCSLAISAACHPEQLSGTEDDCYV